MPKALRQHLEAALDSIGPVVGGLVRSTLQRTGARVVDRAVEILGLGRHGIRLTGPSLATSTQRWEAELDVWSAASVAEASELLILRALSPFFDLAGGEHASVISMTTKWLQAGRSGSGGGALILEWSVVEREIFRRRVLENLANGTTTELTLTGVKIDGLTVVEVEMTVYARARAQLKGNI